LTAIWITNLDKGKTHRLKIA